MKVKRLIILLGAILLASCNGERVKYVRLYPDCTDFYWHQETEEVQRKIFFLEEKLQPPMRNYGKLKVLARKVCSQG